MSVAKKKTKKSQVVMLGPGKGRRYSMGKMWSIFKSDGIETGGKYSISEWWIEPKTKGPGIHFHDEDDVFYVIEGTMSFHVNGKWINAKKGSFVLVPGGTKHDFENRSTKRAGILNFCIPGNFEEHVPGIVDWFKEYPLGSTK